MVHNNSGEYFGRFENGKRHGEGVFTYKKTGDSYSGFWKYGNKHGKGTYIFNDNKIKLIGEWENGNLKHGKWLFPNGVYWEGNFVKNKPSGIGYWHFSDKNQVKSEFIQAEDEDADANPDTGEKPVKITSKIHANVFNHLVFQD